MEVMKDNSIVMQDDLAVNYLFMNIECGMYMRQYYCLKWDIADQVDTVIAMELVDLEEKIWRHFNERVHR